MLAIRRVISLILALALFVGMVPPTVKATELEANQIDKTEISQLPEETMKSTPEHMETEEPDLASGIASGTCGEDLVWMLDTSGTLTISGNGEIPTDAVASPWYEYRQSIRHVVMEEGVTGIGWGAFQACSNMEDVVIPSTVTHIEFSAFYDCAKLSSITIPKNVTYIGDAVFTGCSSLEEILVESENTEYTSQNGILYSKDLTALIQYPAGKVETSFTVPTHVTSLGNSVFADSQLQQIILHDDIVTIGYCAFSGCKKMRNISLPKGISQISTGMFENSGLTELIIPPNITSISTSVFSGCTDLTEITFQGNAPEINSLAFSAVTITARYPSNDPTWTTDIKKDYSGHITWLAYESTRKEGFCGDNLAWFFNETDGVLTISGTGNMWDFTRDEETNTVNHPWADHADNITSVVLDGTVTGIGDYAFFGCSSIAEISGAENLTKIGKGAFSACEKLTAIILPEGLLSIGELAFSSNHALTSIEIPGSVTSIGEEAFYHAWNLTKATLGEGIKEISDSMFLGCYKLTDVSIPSTVTKIETCAFYDCLKLQRIDIPAATTHIGENAFEFCLELSGIWVEKENPNYCSDDRGVLFNKDKTVLIVAPGGLTGAYTIPDTVTETGAYPFEHCSLESVVVPGSLSLIGGDFFDECKNLKEVTIQNGVRTIGAGAFSKCTALKNITIAESITEIAPGTFNKCTALSDVYYGGTEAQWKAIAIADGNECLLNATIHFAEEPCDHSYTAQVTAPTCTEKGFTTYTCKCGDTYQEKEVAALGHAYEDGICTRCHEIDPDYERKVTRIAGRGRCQTAIEAAETLKKLKGFERFQTIIVADAANFPDALTGSYLAAVCEAPILLYLDGQTAVTDYINANLTDDGTVYILGEKDSVSESLEANLKEGVTSLRLAGRSRYATCLEILEKADSLRSTKTEAVLVCSALNFADSLSASATGLPILLVKGTDSTLTTAQLDYLDSLSDVEVYVIGGKNTVSDAILEILHRYDRNGTAERISGTSREKTSAAVAEKFFPEAKVATLAFSQNFPDGLSGGPVAYALKAPLLLIAKDKEAAAANYVAERNIQEGYVFGGSDILSDLSVGKIFVNGKVTE